MRSLGLLLLCASAGATPPCRQVYQMGAAAFDGEDSLSLLTPEDGRVVWTRIAGGATSTVARVPLGVSAQPQGSLPTSTLWADARSDTAWFQNVRLYRIRAGGAVPIISCDADWGNPPRRVAAEFRDHHWSIAVTCGDALSSSRELWLYRQEEGGDPQLLGRMPLTGDGYEPLAMTEDAPGRYAIYAGYRLFDFEGGIFTTGPAAEMSSPAFATDGTGTTLFGIGMPTQILRAERTSGGWSFEPRGVDAFMTSLRAIDRARVVVISEDDEGRRLLPLVESNGAWQVEGAPTSVDWSSEVVDARDHRVALTATAGERVELRIADNGLTATVGTIGVHAGKTGACGCAYGGAGRPEALGLLLVLALVIRTRAARV
jgi:hypothetical protein